MLQPNLREKTIYDFRGSKLRDKSFNNLKPDQTITPYHDKTFLEIMTRPTDISK